MKCIKLTINRTIKEPNLAAVLAQNWTSAPEPCASKGRKQVSCEIDATNLI